MGVNLYKDINLGSPDLFCSWPGIGNVGLIAVDTLRGLLKAEELGELDPFNFFEPRKVVIREGLLKELYFPANKFYYSRTLMRDLMFFVGEEQPSDGEKMYARGEKAYQLASQVLEVAQKFGCRRIITSGACVAPAHHENKPRVVAVASSEPLLKEIKKYPNVVPMNEVGEGSSEGVITGLNGLLLAVAKKKGIDALCLMGEIPDWLARVPFPYPRASKSVLEVMSALLNVDLTFDALDKHIEKIDKVVTSIYEKFPEDVKKVYEQRKSLDQPGPISKEEAEWMKENLDEFLSSLADQEGGDDDEDRPV